MSLESVIDISIKELGNTELPTGSNQTKYGLEYGWNGVPWCVIFLWWCFKHAGESSAFFGGAKTASCGTLLKWYREQGLTVPVEDVQPGDIVILNFKGTLETQHCGLVDKVSNSSTFWVRTIEGNTSPGLEGSQDNGGSVAHKIRYKRNIVGVCRPMYTEEKQKDYKGHWAEKAIDWNLKHKIMNGYPDGTFRPNEKMSRAEVAQAFYNFAQTLGVVGG